MKISIYNTQKLIPISRPALREICKAVTLAESEDFAEVTIHFVSKKKIGELHADFFNDPTPTDCISFPLDEKGDPYRVLGEVFVCPEVAIDYCTLNGGNPYKETMLYVVHGLLHLFGYDDIKMKDRKKMKEAEKRHMDLLTEQGFFVN